MRLRGKKILRTRSTTQCVVMITPLGSPGSGGVGRLCDHSLRRGKDIRRRCELVSCKMVNHYYLLMLAAFATSSFSPPLLATHQSERQKKYCRLKSEVFMKACERNPLLAKPLGWLLDHISPHLISSESWNSGPLPCRVPPAVLSSSIRPCPIPGHCAFKRRRDRETKTLVPFFTSPPQPRSAGPWTRGP